MTGIGTEWLTLLRKAIKRNGREASARYLQLATVAADGAPRNRTVVFRGFAQGASGERGCELLAVTDTRSDKVPEILADPRVELCWYFPLSREQFRIRAAAIVLDDSTTTDAQRQMLWKGLSPGARAQFFWAHPGLPMAPATSADSDAAEGSSGQAAPADTSPGDAPPADEPPRHFVGLRFVPSRVDHLQLKNPQRRALYTLSAEGVWEAVAVNP